MMPVILCETTCHVISILNLFYNNLHRCCKKLQLLLHQIVTCKKFRQSTVGQQTKSSIKPEKNKKKKFLYVLFELKQHLQKNCKKCKRLRQIVHLGNLTK